jgi:transposase
MPAGRPTKLDPEIIARIVNALGAGNYLETAAAFAGISKQTLYRWLRRGARSRSGLHREFVDAVEKALAQAEVRDVATIARAASGYDVVKTIDVTGGDGKNRTTTERTREFAWQAAAWRLERKHPDRWGRRVQLTGEVDHAHKHEGTVLMVGGTPDQYVAALRRARGLEAPTLKPASKPGSEPAALPAGPTSGADE